MYNYFPNKKALLYEVFQTLWGESIEKLDRLIDESESNEALFTRYATALHHEMLQKKGIGKHLFRMELIEANEDENEPFSLTDVQQMKKVIMKSYGLTEKQLAMKNFDRLTNTATMLLMVGNATNQEYVQFLHDLCGSYIREHKILEPSNS